MKSKITIRNVTELLLQIIIIGIGFLTPSYRFVCNYKSHTVIDIIIFNFPGRAIGACYYTSFSESPRFLIIFMEVISTIFLISTIIGLLVAILQMTSSKKSKSVILIVSLLQILTLLTQKIAMQQLSDWSVARIEINTVLTLILFLCLIQLGLCWIGYFALKDNDDPEEDQPTSDSTDNTMSSVVTNDSIEKQLNDCKHLFDAGLISEKEYEEKRKQILGI